MKDYETMQSEIKRLHVVCRAKNEIRDELLEALKAISRTDYPNEGNSGPSIYAKFQSIALEAIKNAEYNNKLSYYQ